MLNPDPIFQIPKKGLYFLSLGGIGEIGANCYLYGSDNKWIMIDLGLTFAESNGHDTTSENGGTRQNYY